MPTIDALYRGTAQPLGPQGKPSAIVKTAVEGPVAISHEGLAGDQQVDLKHHGGPDKALHQYAQADYARLAEHFPELAHKLLPGTMGENFSVPEQDADTVCLGDIYQLGSARIQVSEPRKPCWKINARFDHPDLVKVIDTEGLNGWYFRVLEPGHVQAGDNFQLLERPNPAWPMARFWHCYRRGENLAELHEAASLPGLSNLWQQKMMDILDRKRAR